MGHGVELASGDWDVFELMWGIGPSQAQDATKQKTEPSGPRQTTLGNTPLEDTSVASGKCSF
jgi:hypothetical protein